MGSLMAKLIGQTTDMAVAEASEQPGHPLVGKPLDVPLHQRVVSGAELTFGRSDVYVDFSTPATSMTCLEKARIAKCAAVIGTTGFTAVERERITHIAKEIPVLLSPNMSIGVNLFFRSVQNLALRLTDAYDVEVVEIHHRQKKDAPSGTAKRIIELLGNDVPCHSLRVGDVIGEHQVHFAGNGERIILTHKAESRETFAQGALLAVRFIYQRSPGLYTMFDVLDYINGS